LLTVAAREIKIA